jgi:hypothetical protein
MTSIFLIDLEIALAHESLVRNSVAEHGLSRKNRVYNIAKFYFKCYSFSMLIIILPLTLLSLYEDATYSDESAPVKQA